MSELPKALAEVQYASEPQSRAYEHYFGSIALQQAINSIEAYTDKSDNFDRNIARAWLLDDRTQLDALLATREHAEAAQHAALMRVSTEMWAHIFMQKYTAHRPVRLRGLDQAEIPVV